jgi:hypothetical protein
VGSPSEQIAACGCVTLDDGTEQIVVTCEAHGVTYHRPTRLLRIWHAITGHPSAECELIPHPMCLACGKEWKP